MEHVYGVISEKIKSEPDMTVVYINNPMDFPKIVIGWQPYSDIFDILELYKLAQDFGTKMKQPVPSKVYIMNGICYFEMKTR